MDTLHLLEYVEAAKKNDANAVSELYNYTYSQVYYVIRSMVKEEDTIYKLVQDTYLLAFNNLGILADGSKFLPWVKQIAAHTAKDYLEKENQMPLTEDVIDQKEAQAELIPDERILKTIFRERMLTEEPAQEDAPRKVKAPKKPKPKTAVKAAGNAGDSGGTAMKVILIIAVIIILVGVVIGIVNQFGR